MSTLKVNSIEPATAGSEDYFLARAWVNFNGTGTVAIRQDGNVSSITDNGTGGFTMNFSASLADADYSAAGTNSYTTTSTTLTAATRPYIGGVLSGSYRSLSTYANQTLSGAVDADYIFINIVR